MKAARQSKDTTKLDNTVSMFGDTVSMFDDTVNGLGDAGNNPSIAAAHRSDTGRAHQEAIISSSVEDDE